VASLIWLAEESKEWTKSFDVFSGIKGNPRGANFNENDSDLSSEEEDILGN